MSAEPLDDPIDAAHVAFVGPAEGGDDPYREEGGYEGRGGGLNGDGAASDEGTQRGDNGARHQPERDSQQPLLPTPRHALAHGFIFAPVTQSQHAEPSHSARLIAIMRAVHVA